uniref:uL6m n=1 Tax=Polytomella magna TaxID=353565 RepID=UPI002240E42C|nr:Chain Ae, uL6m [Polytomella magna]8APN_Ae Chain Ae, uL6m [Polytomella magna]8APO_Ae Chain Ae, uL6m [Polytomella magna]
YKIPDKIKWPKTPYSKICGRPAPEAYPIFEILKNADKPDVWQRSLIRFPEGVEARVDEETRVLHLEGKAGSVSINMKNLDPTGLLAYSFEQNSLVMLSPSKEKLNAFVQEIQKSVRGASQGYLVGLTVKGVGYRMEPVEDIPAKYLSWSRPVYFDRTTPPAYPFKKPAKAVLLKIGFTDPAVFMLPPTIKAFFLKPTLMYLYGLNIDELRKTAMDIRALRKPNVFTGNGIALLDETVRIKQR